MKFNFEILKWLCLSSLLMVLDIGSKFWIKNHCALEEILYVFPGINCYYMYNSGLALGLFSGMGQFFHIFLIWIIITLIIVYIIVLNRSMKRTKYIRIAYSMIIGGALGNLFDRILYGEVIDFIDINIKGWHFPVFNLADINIVIGIMILLIQHYFNFFYKKK